MVTECISPDDILVCIAIMAFLWGLVPYILCLSCVCMSVYFTVFEEHNTTLSICLSYLALLCTSRVRPLSIAHYWTPHWTHAAWRGQELFDAYDIFSCLRFYNSLVLLLIQLSMPRDGKLRRSWNRVDGGIFRDSDVGYIQCRSWLWFQVSWNFHGATAWTAQGLSLIARILSTLQDATWIPCL